MKRYSSMDDVTWFSRDNEIWFILKESDIPFSIALLVLELVWYGVMREWWVIAL